MTEFALRATVWVAVGLVSAFMWVILARGLNYREQTSRGSRKEWFSSLRKAAKFMGIVSIPLGPISLALLIVVFLTAILIVMLTKIFKAMKDLFNDKR